MPSPMIYQDLTTTALLGHAAQPQRDRDRLGERWRRRAQQLGEVACRAQRLASALASLGLPPGAAAPPSHGTTVATRGIYFAVASGGWVTHTVNPRLSVDHLLYILNDAADEVLFFDRTFCRW
ncbi:AMP-binding protein [Klebsiella quasipneumoniae subsp. similipneumoniae]